jgi:hypothetical protein
MLVSFFISVWAVSKASVRVKQIIFCSVKWGLRYSITTQVAWPLMTNSVQSMRRLCAKSMLHLYLVLVQKHLVPIFADVTTTGNEVTYVNAKYKSLVYINYLRSSICTNEHDWIYTIAVPRLVPHTKWVDVYSPRSHAQLPVAVTRGNATSSNCTINWYAVNWYTTNRTNWD